MKAVVAAFNQEKALVGAFSVITNLRMELFEALLSLCSIVTQKRKVGTIAPKKFIARLRKEKIEFDNYMQQVPEQIVEEVLK